MSCLRETFTKFQHSCHNLDKSRTWLEKYNILAVKNTSWLKMKIQILRRTLVLETSNLICLLLAYRIYANMHIDPNFVVSAWCCSKVSSLCCDLNEVTLINFEMGLHCVKQAMSYSKTECIAMQTNSTVYSSC